MTRARAAVFLVLAVILVGLAALAIRTFPSPRVVTVPAGGSMEAAADRAGEGGTVILSAGRHGPFSVDMPVKVVADPAAVVRGPITVRADGASLHGIAVRGGETGVLIQDADGVTVEDVDVWGTSLHGVEVVEASATLRRVSVSGLLDEFAQGIEIRNTNGHRPTLVEASSVDGGMEGIVSHVAPVVLRGNTVRGTDLRGIAVTEMSTGRVEENTVESATGMAYYCGDMSLCEFRDNRARDIRAVPGTAVHQEKGHGLVLFFHSVASVERNDLQSSGAQVARFVSSRLDPGLRLPWPPGWAGGWPGAAIALGLAFGGLMAVRRALRRPALALSRRPGRRSAPSHDAMVLVLLGGIAVQGFHMLEHLVQAHQVHVAASAGRSGLLGAAVDTEWLHFVYNTSVLAFLVTLLLMRLRGWVPPVGEVAVRRGDGFLIAALGVQSYHEVEHLVKVGQHVFAGAKVAPGLLGNAVDLVWLHMGINLAVFAGFALAARAYSWGTVVPALRSLEARMPRARARAAA